MPSCNINRYVPKHKYLVKNIKLKHAPKETKDDLETYSLLKPNSQFLGVMYWQSPVYNYLRAQRYSDKFELKQDDKVKSGKWEEPEILDSGLLQGSAGQMASYLQNKGYFHSKVSYTINTHGDTVAHGGKATITYDIKVGVIYYINKIDYKIQDHHLDSILKANMDGQILSTGDQYDADNIDAEKDRITSLFKNNGYYAFSGNYFNITADTTVGKHRVNITFIISNPPGKKHHTIFVTKNVFVEPKFFSDTIVNDSFVFINGRYFSSNIDVKPAILSDFIFYDKGYLFHADDYKNTYSRILDMNVYSYINIGYVPDTSLGKDTGTLDVHVQLAPAGKQIITYGLEFSGTEENTQFATTQPYNWLVGPSANISYIDRDILQSAVQWRLGLTGSINLPFSAKHAFDPLFDQTLLDFGINNSFTFPQLLLPRHWFRSTEGELSKRTSTALNTNYIIENNLDYQRKTLNLNLLYTLNNKNQSYFITPIEFNFIHANIINTAFGDTIKSLNDPLISDLFRTHIISDARFAYQVNSPPQGGLKAPLSFFRWTVEEGGALAGIEGDAIAKLQGKTNPDTGTLFGIQDYRYVRTELDYRFYYPFSPVQTLAFHADFGFGVPYGNAPEGLSSELPFEKSFFMGGPNDVRGWHLRQLGPGSYNGVNSQLGNLVFYDRSGDVKLENSIEYRFPVWKYLKSALFLDGGNVWLLHKEAAWPGGQLPSSFDQFYKEYAIGTGLGIRLDFNFFILCLDLGLPLKDPSQTVNNGWIDYSLKYADTRGNLSRTILNISLGYPF